MGLPRSTYYDALSRKVDEAEVPKFDSGLAPTPQSMEVDAVILFSEFPAHEYVPQ